jgi:hypothetical protein
MNCPFCISQVSENRGVRAALISLFLHSRAVFVKKRGKVAANDLTSPRTRGGGGIGRRLLLRLETVGKGAFWCEHVFRCINKCVRFASGALGKELCCNGLCVCKSTAI